MENKTLLNNAVSLQNYLFTVQNMTQIDGLKYSRRSYSIGNILRLVPPRAQPSSVSLCILSLSPGDVTGNIIKS